MIRSMFCFAILGIACQCGWAQEATQTASGKQDAGEQQAAEPAEHQPIRDKLSAYLECFNSGDAQALCGHWTEDCQSVSAETGEQTTGRDALQQEFAAFFAGNPGAQLTGDVIAIRLVRPDVATVEGRTTLYVPDGDPVDSAFTAVMVKEGDQWLISSSHERDLPAPASPYDALKEMEWLIGTWQDQTEGAQVTSTLQWSPSQAFLIRSFTADFEDADSLEGTQIIGWDPLGKQIRTWTFHSDGSFGQGTLTRHDDDWMMKLWQIGSDGVVSTGTKVLSRVDNDTITVQTIGETVGGEPRPASDPVTVVRIADVDADAQGAEEAPAAEQGDSP